MGNKEISRQDYDKAREFVKKVECANLPRNKFGVELKFKKNTLKDFGYTVLYGKDDCVVDLDDCSPSRITNTYFNVYDSSKRKVALFEGRVESLDSFRSLILLLDEEVNLRGGDLEEARERIAIVMDSASDLELELLGRKYGKKVLGDYAMHLKIQRVFSQKESQVSDDVEVDTYSRFMEEHGEHNSYRVEDMRERLIRHFPWRFGENGNQPIGNSSAQDVMDPYTGVVATGRDIISKH